MRIAVLGNWNDKLLEETMEEVIEEFPLFMVVCGGNDENQIRKTAGFRWAEKYGAPIEYLRLDGKKIDNVIDRLVKAIDYAVIAYSENDTIVRRVINKLKMNGKHGKVIKIL